MKRKTSRKKLHLNKQTVRTLGQSGMIGVHGGGLTPRLAPGMNPADVSGVKTERLQQMGREQLTTTFTPSFVSVTFTLLHDCLPG